MSVDEPPTGMEAHDCSFPPPADFPIVQVEQRPSLPVLVIKRKRSLAWVTEIRLKVGTLGALVLQNKGLSIRG